MSRSVSEWIGRTDNSQPPARVKERILRAHGGRCALTGREFAPGDVVEFDHIVALALGGENAEGNLQPVLGSAHKVKTRDDVRAKAKASRGFKKHFGLKKMPRRLVPGSKGSGMRKRLDGTVVFVREERR